jgi:hypothetical protein
MTRSATWCLCFKLSDWNFRRFYYFSDAWYDSFHLILLDIITLKISDEEYKLWSSSLCNSLHTLVIFSPLGPNSTLFSDTLNLRSSLNLRDQDSHLNETSGNFWVCTETTGEIEYFELNGSEHSLNLVCSCVPSECKDGLLQPACLPAWLTLPQIYE